MTYLRTQAEDRAQIQLGDLDTYFEPGEFLRYSPNPLDASPALQRAVAQYQAEGEAIVAPAGRWACRAPVRGLNNVDSVFSQGVAFRGAGKARTIFDICFSRDGAGNPAYLFDIGTTADNRFALDCTLADFQIGRGESGDALHTGGGIRIRRGFTPLFQNLWLLDLLGDMINAPVVTGDPDACNQGLIDRCRLEAGRAWAFNIDSAPDRNEGSFWTVQDSFFRGCGNALEQTSGPASGAIRVRGAQQLNLVRTIFAETENCAVYMPGGGGVNTVVTAKSVQWENCRKRAVYSIMGVDRFHAQDCGLYNNDDHVAIAGMEFNGDGEAGAGIVRNVTVDGLIVRATPKNKPYVALKAFARNAVNCHASNISVQTDQFPRAGQALAEGFALT
jgi:hypothetical protein